MPRHDTALRPGNIRLKARDEPLERVVNMTLFEEHPRLSLSLEVALPPGARAPRNAPPRARLPASLVTQQASTRRARLGAKSWEPQHSGEGGGGEDGSRK